MGDIPPERPKMSFFGLSGYVRHLRNAGAGNRDGAFSVPQHRRRVLEEKKRWEANLANIEKKIGFYEETRSGGIGKNPA